MGLYAQTILVPTAGRDHIVFTFHKIVIAVKMGGLRIEFNAS